MGLVIALQHVGYASVLRDTHCSCDARDGRRGREYGRRGTVVGGPQHAQNMGIRLVGRAVGWRRLGCLSPWSCLSNRSRTRGCMHGGRHVEQAISLGLGRFVVHRILHGIHTRADVMLVHKKLSIANARSWSISLTGIAVAEHLLPTGIAVRPLVSRYSRERRISVDCFGKRQARTAIIQLERHCLTSACSSNNPATCACAEAARRPHRDHLQALQLLCNQRFDKVVPRTSWP
jgi:hypothetical protein